MAAKPRKKKIKVEPQNIPLYAGTRTELDLKFLRILSELPEDTNINDFIKQSVVDRYDKSAVTGQTGLDMAAILQEIRELRQKVNGTISQSAPTDPADRNNVDDETKGRIDGLTDAF